MSQAFHSYGPVGHLGRRLFQVCEARRAMSEKTWTRFGPRACLPVASQKSANFWLWPCKLESLCADPSARCRATAIHTPCPPSHATRPTFAHQQPSTWSCAMHDDLYSEDLCAPQPHTQKPNVLNPMTSCTPKYKVRTRTIPSGNRKQEAT